VYAFQDMRIDPNEAMVQMQSNCNMNPLFSTLLPTSCPCLYSPCGSAGKGLSNGLSARPSSTSFIPAGSRTSWIECRLDELEIRPSCLGVVGRLLDGDFERAVGGDADIDNC
jgi:hypothetical protein